ncbi:unnamed protein product, partial [Cladocopium goreaui]
MLSPSVRGTATPPQPTAGLCILPRACGKAETTCGGKEVWQVLGRSLPPKMNAARDHGQRQMVAAVERRKEPEVQVRRSRSSTIRWFQAMVTHPAFDVFFAALVGLNTIFMGIDAELQLADHIEQGESVALSVTRRIFTVAFTVELVLRIVAHGRDFFCKVNFWNWLDTVIVVAGLAEATFDVIHAAAGEANVPSMVSC